MYSEIFEVAFIYSIKDDVGLEGIICKAQNSSIKSISLSMKDGVFKKLVHFAEGYSIVNSGKQLAKGYKPDTVLQNQNEYIIMECDTGTSRKGYLGAMLKASKFLTMEKQGIFILVIKEKPNTTVKQIAEHLREYLVWIKTLTNLRLIYLIETTKYCPDNEPVKILSTEFLRDAIAIAGGA
ncbi:MAG TPA: hypothetical protein PKM40_00445 [Bacteroidia bacterium]|nr:hypothetical protein [Bacteroidia bacterium]